MQLLRGRSRQLRQRWSAGSAVLLLALAIAAVTILYTNQERNYHWWVDWWSRTRSLADLVPTLPSVALQQIQTSLSWERNSLYTLPLIPFMLVLGSSRWVYEIGLAWVYLLPFCLVMGAIGQTLLTVPQATQQHANRTAPPAVFWITAGLTLLLPVNWTPTFLGIPDTGGALFIALATLIYLQDVQLKRVWRSVAIGGLIACAILLRRHFAYGGVALLVAIGIYAAWQTLREAQAKPTAFGQAILRVGLRLSLIVTTLLGIMQLVAGEFTLQALTQDYRNLYTSWSLPLTDTLQRYLGFYGWITWLLALGGWGIAAFSQTLVLQRAIPFCLFGGSSVLIWLGGLRYGNVFYALHITPLIVGGLAALVWTLQMQLQGQWRKLLLAGLACYLIGNWTLALLPPGPLEALLRSHLAFNMAPLVRTDEEALVNLINYLRQLTPNGEAIYIAGYQRLQLNTSLIRAVEQVQYPQERSRLNLLLTPQVDSQDFYPLQPLLQAEYVVIPEPLLDYPGSPAQVTPLGEWILPQETQVVRVVLTAFAEHWELAQDFEPLPVQFQLDYGTTVRLFHRVKPTSVATALRSLLALQQRIGKRPGGQLDWIGLGQEAGKIQVSQNWDNSYRLVSFPCDRLRSLRSPAPLALVSPLSREFYDNSTTFVYAEALQGQTQITGWLTLWTPPCQGASLKLMTLTSQGTIVDTASSVIPRQPVIRFQRSLRAKSGNYLLLQVLGQDNPKASADTAYCTVDMNQLVVSLQATP